MTAHPYAQDSVTLELILKDSSGNVLPNWPVRFYATGTDVAIDRLEGTTDSTGTYGAAITTSQAQEVDIFAEATGLTLVTSVDFSASQTCIAAPTFSSIEKTTEVTAWAVAVGDVDGDGKLDIVSANKTFSSTVSVLLGNGDGTFQNEAPYDTGTQAYSIALADFNNDGKLDIVTASNVGAGAANVSLGNGDGTFQNSAPYSVGEYPYGVVVGDFNGDGKVDIATANLYDSTVSMLLGKGDGTFHNQTTSDVGTYPYAIATTDFNDDGKLDIVTANYGISGAGTTISVLLGNGDGTFANAAPFTVGTSPEGVAVGDFNNDGNPDIVVTDDAYDSTTSSYNVSILLGNGDGTFQNQATFAVGTFPLGVAVGDFNGDGKVDIVVSNNDGSGSTMSVLLGNNDGTFPNQISLAVANQPVGVAVGDFNNDGRLDFVTAIGNTSTPAVEVLMNTCR